MSDEKVSMLIRLSKDLHKEAKLEAVRSSVTLQKWVTTLIEEKLLASRASKQWVCQDCGKWPLRGTQMAKIGICVKCQKHDCATFPI